MGPAALRAACFILHVGNRRACDAAPEPLPRTQRLGNFTYIRFTAKLLVLRHLTLFTNLSVYRAGRPFPTHQPRAEPPRMRRLRVPPPARPLACLHAMTALAITSLWMEHHAAFLGRVTKSYKRETAARGGQVPARAAGERIGREARGHTRQTCSPSHSIRARRSAHTFMSFAACRARMHLRAAELVSRPLPL